MRRAVIVGHGGQDGRILWDQLAAQGFALVGLSRGGRRVHGTGWNSAVDIGDAGAVRDLVGSFQPDQVYYLAAYHHSSQESTVDDAAVWQASWATHVQGFFHFLDAVRQCRPSTRLFYASSSRVFGMAPAGLQTERTPLRPACLYGITKASGMMLADFFRRTHGIHVSCGILFNHESPLRGAQFVSQRVVDGLAALKVGRTSAPLEIGNLEARVDWGYAPDYTRAMQLIVETDQAEDFVVASGETHSVREMIEIAAAELGLDWAGNVVQSGQILQRAPQGLCGDPSRLRQVTGWQPSLSFAGMVRAMAAAALARAVAAP